MANKEIIVNYNPSIHAKGTTQDERSNYYKMMILCTVVGVSMQSAHAMEKKLEIYKIVGEGNPRPERAPKLPYTQRLCSLEVLRDKKGNVRRDEQGMVLAATKHPSWFMTLQESQEEESKANEQPKVDGVKENPVELLTRYIVVSEEMHKLVCAKTKITAYKKIFNECDPEALEHAPEFKDVRPKIDNMSKKNNPKSEQELITICNELEVLGQELQCALEKYRANTQPHKQ